MPYDRYTDNPALRPTILASALKPAQLPTQPSTRSGAGEDQGSRETPRAA